MLLALAGAAQARSIDLVARPTRVPADGVSTITISAIVRDGAALVSDSVAVLFTTTAGELTEFGGGGLGGQQMLVQTQGGRAQVQIRATTYETTALIMASLRDGGATATAQTTVVFGTQAVESIQFEDILKVSAAYLAYHPDASLMTMECLGDVEVSYQGVEIRAPRMQIYVGDEMLVARDFQGRISVGVGPPPYPEPKEGEEAPTGPPYFGDALLFDLRTMNGALYSTRSGVTQFFAGRTLQPMEPMELPPDSFDMIDIATEGIVIRSKKALIYPNEKIRFDQPQFYAAGKRMFSLPYYFEPLGYYASGGLPAGPAGFSQYISYSSQDGLIVNFPYYFNMSDLATNEITLARGGRSGVFSRETGWQVYYRHYAELPYNTGDWSFTVDRIGKQFGLSYTRDQRFGQSTYTSLAVTWPEHRNLYSNANLYTRLGPGSLNLTANLDNLAGPGGGIYHNTNVVWQSNPLRVPALGGSRFAMALGAGYSHAVGGRDYWRQSASLTWDHTPWRVNRGGMIFPYAGLRFSNTLHGNREIALTFNTSYRQELPGGMSLGLGYTFDKSWNTLYNLPDRHLLSLDWQLLSSKWRSYIYGSYSIRDTAVSASALVDYSLSKHWGLQAQTVWQTSNYGSFSETEFWVYRLLGGREIRLRYNIERQRIYFEIDNAF